MEYQRKTTFNVNTLFLSFVQDDVATTTSSLADCVSGSSGSTPEEEEDDDDLDEGNGEGEGSDSVESRLEVINRVEEELRAANVPSSDSSYRVLSADTDVCNYCSYKKRNFGF